jgi:1-deoxy-D-xylulose-5-phosphate reductoisomerase
LKRIAILGSTGSIGTQTLEIISLFPDRFAVEVLTANNNVDLLIKQAKEFLPDSVVLANDTHYLKLTEALKDLPIKVYAGSRAIEQIVSSSEIDIVLTAMVGFSGLKPTIEAIKSGKVIALANKETLVVAGELISKLVQDSSAKIIPVDSEHSAILQCLVGEAETGVEKITLTASGGPFRNLSSEELKNVSPERALNHPNWCMGNKITIDSASMMNKGLEVIEAKWLFDLKPDQIEVIIHPQSIIHSFVHFIDGSVKAQLGLPDMRLPIIYALEFPERIKTDLARFKMEDFNSLTFEPVDLKKFRNLALAFDALDEGGTAPCIMNAANEVAVESFLNNSIGFVEMTGVIEEVLQRIPPVRNPDLETLEAMDDRARNEAMEIVKKLVRK